MARAPRSGNTKPQKEIPMKRTLNHLRRVGAIAAAAAATGLLLIPGPAPAQVQGKIKIGLMLP
jgi:hypothetical protein